MVVVEDGLPEAVATRLNPAERYGLRETLLVVAVALVGVPFGLLLQQVTAHGPLTKADTSLANWLHGQVRDNSFLTAVMKTLAEFGIPERASGTDNSPLKSYVTLRMPDRGGAEGGTPELYFRDPDGLLLQLQDVKYCGGGGFLGEVCLG